MAPFPAVGYILGTAADSYRSKTVSAERPGHHRQPEYCHLNIYSSWERTCGPHVSVLLINRTRPVFVDAFVGFAKIVGPPFLRQHHSLIYVATALAEKLQHRCRSPIDNAPSIGLQKAKRRTCYLGSAHACVVVGRRSESLLERMQSRSFLLSSAPRKAFQTSCSGLRPALPIRSSRHIAFHRSMSRSSLYASRSADAVG